MKEYGIRCSQTWLHLSNLDMAQNYFIYPYACKLLWFPAKLAGLQGSHASSSYGNQPKNPGLAHISCQGHFLWAIRTFISENALWEKDGRDHRRSSEVIVNHSQDYTVILWWQLKNFPGDPRKCNIHFYSNLIPTRKIIPVLDFH